MAIDWSVLNGWVNDDGSNTTGTLVNKANLQAAFRDPIDAGLAAVVTALSLCDGRLTATTGVPVTTADVSGATSIYFTPYAGNQIALYDGATWNVRTFTEITISLAGLTASKPYDIFAYDNATVVTIEKLVWTNETTRATALTTQDGVLVKSGAPTRRFIATVYINASGGQTDDTFAKRYIWNYYNRVLRPLRVTEATNSWTYTTATWRQANAAATNQLDLVVGVAEVALEVTLAVSAYNGAVGSEMAIAIGEDSTTAPMANAAIGFMNTTGAASVAFIAATQRCAPAIGRHVYVWLEWSEAANTTTWLGDNGNPSLIQSGIFGSIYG